MATPPEGTANARDEDHLKHRRFFMLRNDEIKKLRFEENWTLQEIANKYDISRERVRQIVGNSGYQIRGASQALSLPDNPLLTISELFNFAKSKIRHMNINILKSKIASQHHAVIGSIGEDGEIVVHNKLNEMGIKNSLMPFGYKFDIITDKGITIDVKTCLRKFKPHKNNKSTYYRFSIRTNTKNDCDIFIFYAVKDKRFWIVPYSVLPKTEAVCIVADLGVRSWETSNVRSLEKYENNFSLLK
jgi:predicted DNA-binding protein YlxM (UPF0122 family)